MKTKFHNLDDEKLAELNIVKKGRLKNTIIPSKITVDLAYVCGVLAGDGNIHIRPAKHDYAIKCVGNPRDEKEYYDFILTDLFYNIFGIKIKPRLLDKNTTYGFVTWSKTIVAYLTQNIGLPGGRKDNLAIPETLMKNKKLTRSFIQGFMDTDGCLALKKMNKTYKYYPVIMGASKSDIIINQISEFLRSDGFVVKIKQRNYYDKRVNKIETTYIFSIYGHDNLAKWMKIIGFRHPKHLGKVKSWKEVNRENKRAFSAIEKIKL